MAIKTNYKDTEFGVGDRVRVSQKIKEGEKTRDQIFEGVVIAIKNSKSGKSFTVRRIGEQKIGIERIFPLMSPTITSINVVKKGTRGVKRSKLYYIREKSQKEIDKIYLRANHKNLKKES